MINANIIKINDAKLDKRCLLSYAANQESKDSWRRGIAPVRLQESKKILEWAAKSSIAQD